MKINKETLINVLNLVEHDEGGMFFQTCESDKVADIGDGKTRPLYNSIYYMLDEKSPICHLHRNKSDIVTYFHAGSVLDYILISEDRKITYHQVGIDLAKNHRPQLLIPGGYWCCAVLSEGEFALVSEAVIPGFDYDDRDLMSKEELFELFPEYYEQLKEYTTNE